MALDITLWSSVKYMTFFTLTLILFVIMDPVGAMSSCKRLMAPLSPQRRRWVLFREMLIALSVALLFSLIGEFFFIVLSLSEASVRLASGAVMFLISMGMLFPKLEEEEDVTEEPWIFPLAIPRIAGPALIATVMLFSHIEESVVRMFLAIIVAWAASLLVLWFANPLKRILTDNGIIALERLMGMILLLLAVQRFMEGITLFLRSWN